MRRLLQAAMPPGAAEGAGEGSATRERAAEGSTATVGSEGVASGVELSNVKEGLLLLCYNVIT